LFPVFHRSLALIGSLFQQQQPCSTRDLLPCQGLHALAAVDVMVSIADMLESDHGWSIEQSEAWLHRMGLWEEFYCEVRPSRATNPVSQ
jgi:hypothetical protein